MSQVGPIQTNKLMGLESLLTKEVDAFLFDQHFGKRFVERFVMNERHPKISPDGYLLCLENTLPVFLEYLLGKRFIGYFERADKLTLVLPFEISNECQNTTIRRSQNTYMMQTSVDYNNNQLVLLAKTIYEFDGNFIYRLERGGNDIAFPKTLHIGLHHRFNYRNEDLVLDYRDLEKILSKIVKRSERLRRTNLR